MIDRDISASQLVSGTNIDLCDHHPAGANRRREHLEHLRAEQLAPGQRKEPFDMSLKSIVGKPLRSQMEQDPSIIERLGLWFVRLGWLYLVVNLLLAVLVSGPATGNLTLYSMVTAGFYGGILIGVGRVLEVLGLIANLLLRLGASAEEEGMTAHLDAVRSQLEQLRMVQEKTRDLTHHGARAMVHLAKSATR